MAYGEGARKLQANAQAGLLAADLSEKHPDVYGVLIDRDDDGELTFGPYDGYGHAAPAARQYLKEQSHLNLDHVGGLSDIFISRQLDWTPGNQDAAANSLRMGKHATAG